MSETVRFDMISKSTADALLKVANSQTAIKALTDKKDALVSLAEKAEELLALLQTEETSGS